MAFAGWKLIALMLLPTLTLAKDYCVIPGGGTNSQVRPSKMNSSCNCDEHFILSNYSSLLGELNDSTILFCEGMHYLKAVWNINDSSNLIFSSVRGRAVVTCKEQESGIYFRNVSNITLEDIEFKHCGITNSAHSRSYYNRAALLFAQVGNLKMNRILIQEPSTAGGFSLNHMHGEVLIRDSMFKNGRIGKNETSGNFIGHGTFDSSLSIITILNTSFENNSYIFKKQCNNGDHRLSAGLAIVILFPNIQISLNNVTFRNNSGCGGGNVAILYQVPHCVTANSSALVSITNNSIIDGGFASIGGGILILMSLWKFSEFSISDTRIVNNRAVYNGGGIFIKAIDGMDLGEQSFINISNCHFEKNKLNLQTKANGGYALQVTTFFTKGFKTHKTPQLNVSISSSSFINHGIQDKGNITSGDAVLYLKNTPNILIQDINVTNNACSGMTAIASNILLAGTVTISNNTAYSGGGILLCSDALLYFKSNTQLIVTGNHANYTGGGINIESGCTLNNPPCFFQFYSTYYNTIIAIVEGNTANYSGDNIFGGSIHNCYLIESHHLPRNVFYKLFKVPKNPKEHNSSISSKPRQLHLQKYDKNVAIMSGQTLLIRPGQTMKFKAIIYGQENGTTPGVVHASLSNPKVHMRRGDAIQTPINTKYNSISYGIFSEVINEFVNLSLSIAEGTANPHEKSTFLTLHIKECPFGMKLDQKSSQSACRCTYLKYFNSHTKMIRCEISYPPYIRYSTELWIGGFCEVVNCTSPELTLIALSIVCPQDYCKKTNVLLHLIENPFINNTVQCDFNRSGILCGKCIPGRSVILGSSECRPCSNYYLFLLLLFILAGPALVFIISFLNLTVSSATLNGIIFYANVVQIYDFSIFHIRTAFLKVFISWLNLDFGISMCFFDGMNGFSKSLLQFVFPVYLWAIAGIVVWLSKRYKVMVNLFGTNSVQVLATLVLLSYTKLIRASADAIHFTRLLLPEAPHNRTYSLRWSIDGNLRFLEGHHIIVFTIGVLFGLLSLLYTLILLFVGHLPRISHWPFFSWIYKLKPFFDCYTGPLSNKGRFWVGLLLAVRIFLLGAYSINISSGEASKMTATIIVVMILLFFSLVSKNGIYNKHHLNVLETFSIVNLGILFTGLLCSYHYHLESTKKAFVFSSLSIAFLLFLMIIASRTYYKLGGFKILRKILRSHSDSSSSQHSRVRERSVTSCTSLGIPPYDFNEDFGPLLEP